MTDQSDTQISLLSGKTSLTVSEIREAARKAARGFKEMGLENGDVVALLLRNDTAFIIASEAARFHEIGIVPMNWHLTAKEVDYILKDCGAKALIVHTDLFSDDIRAAAKNIDCLVVETSKEIAKTYRIDVKRCSASSDDVLWNDWLSKQSTITFQTYFLDTKCRC